MSFCTLSSDSIVDGGGFGGLLPALRWWMRKPVSATSSVTAPPIPPINPHGGAVGGGIGARGFVRGELLGTTRDGRAVVRGGSGGTSSAGATVGRSAFIER